MASIKTLLRAGANATKRQKIEKKSNKYGMVKFEYKCHQS
jgi:hypothetical protein